MTEMEERRSCRNVDGGATAEGGRYRGAEWKIGLGLKKF